MSSSGWLASPLPGDSAPGHGRLLAAVFADPATAEWQAKPRPASRIGFVPIPFPFSKKGRPEGRPWFNYSIYIQYLIFEADFEIRFVEVLPTPNQGASL